MKVKEISSKDFAIVRSSRPSPNNSLDDSESKTVGEQDWSSVLDSDKSNEMQSSEKLREFYKKLVQTDAKIKSLKKFHTGPSYLDSADNLLKSPERSKRSLKLYSYPKGYHVIRRRSANNKDKGGSFKRRQTNGTRLRRFGGNSDKEPTGFVIEKKKLIVQYKPAGIKRRLPVKKCSHAPKDSHTHENQLKHPFYKNTQRLDELLDKFLNNNLPEIMSDPFGLDLLFKHDKNKCKHPTLNKSVPGKDTLVDQIPKPKSKFKKVKNDNDLETKSKLYQMLNVATEPTKEYEKDFYSHEAQMIGKEKQKIVTASPNDFEVLLSVSTIMNPDIKKSGKEPVISLIDKVPNIRRLMQLEGEDDENLGYEDFKEVLTDDLENHEDMESRLDRRKRRDDQIPQEKIIKYNPPGVHNPNWKGAMPLYPDELNSMIRHAALNANKVEIPSNPNLMQSEFLERRGRDLSDVEYVEDYLNNKYSRLVEMAQAYSDYGVLDGKKESRNEKNSASDVTATEHRVKLSDHAMASKARLLEKLKKDRLPSIMRSTKVGRRLRDTPGITDEMNKKHELTEQTGGIINTFVSTPTRTSEGIRFELCPTTKAREDIQVGRLLQKHLKIAPDLQSNLHRNNSVLQNHAVHSTLISSYPDVELVYSTKQDTTSKYEFNKKLFKSNDDTIEKENGLIFALSKSKRNLLSTDFRSTADFPINVDSTEDFDDSMDTHDIDIEEFIENLNLKSYNDSQESEKELALYMESLRQKNIRIYSSVHPDLTNFTDTSTKDFDYLSSIRPFVLYGKSGETSPGVHLNNTIITINRSEIKVDDDIGNIFEGKIRLTVENPEIGTEHIDLRFDVPLIINFNDEFMLMNDSLNMKNNYSQFDIPAATAFQFNEQNETDPDIFTEPYPEPDILENMAKRKRFKRNNTLLGKHIYINTTGFPTETPGNFTPNGSLNFNVTNNVPTKNSRSPEVSDADMTLSDFFMMISNWFKTLDGVKFDKPSANSGPELSEILIHLNKTSIIQNSTDTAYPIYDSDMIENIGHRSRVLLSIENLVNATGEMKKMGEANVTRVKREKATDGNAFNATEFSTPTGAIKFNITTQKKVTRSKPKHTKKTKNTKSKAIFKRNADDSNLIFWNDIYDDEYGIQTESLDNSVRDKHSVRDNDFIKRSGSWVHNKLKKFAENLKINPRSQEMEIKERIPRSVKQTGIGTYPRYIYDQITDRLGRRDSDERNEEDYDTEQKSIFTALSANMKEVCKKAARAVQQTRNIEVREDSKQGTIAASLMQQLVRLLTDLVDYQVQQKTCTRLPQDLQNFLEWLTYQTEEAQETPGDALTFRTPFQEEDLIEELEFQNAEAAEKTTDRMQEFATQISHEKVPPIVDAKLYYLQCLHAVQDLLDQYEEMSDDEKSKMTGIKSYLENQVRYLNKQLSNYEPFNFFEKHNQMRYKRDLNIKNRFPLKRRRRKLNKFIKNFGKKHTRTTASYYDGLQVSEMKRNTIKTVDISDTKIDSGLEEKSSNDVKRNLKDVYYKAIAEAKKYATAKNLHRKDEVTSFATTSPATRP